MLRCGYGQMSVAARRALRAAVNNWRAGITCHIFNAGAAALAKDAYGYYADGGIFSPESWHQGYSDTINPGQSKWDRRGQQVSAVHIDG